MSPGEREHARFLFAEALGLAPADRPGYLDRECGAEDSIRRSVEALLAEHECGSGVLDRPLFAPPVEPAADVWTGKLLNSRYRIERFLARGGSSAVYLARDQQIAGKRVVVKFLHAWGPEFGRLKARFRQEMEVLARIDHYGVVGVLDTGETADGLPFLVIEYITGVTLRSEMGRGPMAPARAARLIRQIGRAVGAAHAQGVLHRDLKPENIMLESPGAAEERVRLIDFGIARLDDAAAATNTTQFAGTTPYMAPEQLRGKACAASDVYAMAVLAYEMLAGQRPFSGAGPIEIYEQQKAGARLKPLLDRGISEPAARLIAQQLAFRPQDRSASAPEAADAAADALLDSRNRFWSRRRAIAALGGGGIVAAAGGLAAWSGRNSLSPAERIIELPPGSEPLEHGFLARSDIDNRVIMNADATRIDGIRLVSGDQGGYYHPLRRTQAAVANRAGWKAAFEAAVEEGNAYLNVDIADAPARYLLILIASQGSGDIVRLFTGYTPAFHGIDLALDGAPGARHRYTLARAPGSQSADLWVDGVKRYSGYAGITQYVYRRGPEIGVNRYRSARGAGVFWGFRFEIG